MTGILVFAWANARKAFCSQFLNWPRERPIKATLSVSEL